MARRSRRSRRSNQRYRFTPKRQAALRKAQLVSARERKGGIRGKHVAVGAAVLGTALIGGVVAHHKIRGNTLGVSVTSKNKSIVTGKTHPLLQHANLGGQHQVSVGIGARRLRINYDTRGHGTRAIARHRADVMGRLVAQRRLWNSNFSPDYGPDMTKRREGVVVKNPTTGGAAHSRQVRFGTYPLDEKRTTHTSVTHPIARRIMAESKHAVFGTRTRSR